MRFTKKAIDHLKTAKKQEYFWDDSAGGTRFGICVYRSGRKAYVFDYRGPDGKRKRMNLCACSAMPPTEARKLARKVAADLAKGIDPLDERQKARVRGMSLSELWERYQADFLDHPHPQGRQGRRPLSLKTRESYRWYWKRLLSPALGKRPIEGITKQDVKALHRKLGRKSPTNANRTLALLGSLFSYAERADILEPGSNPTHGIVRFEERKRERFLSSEELSRLGEALREAEKGEPWQSLAAVRLLLFTGARKTEVLTMGWNDLDLEHGVWNLPEGKTGARTIYLPPPALTILAGLPRLAGCRWVLPACRGEGHFVGLQKGWERIRAAAGLEGVRIHDLRHTTASVGRAGGLPLGILQELLGHKEARTTERYAHIGASPIQEGAELIAGRIAEALKRKEDRHGAEVVQYPGKAGG